MKLDPEHEAETTHKLAGIFYHFYSNELTRAECPNCENRLEIEKENALKDIRLRFWRLFLRTTNGERYFPLKEFLFGGLFKVQGFFIIHTSAGEDLLMCCECQELFSVFDVNDELDIMLYEGFDEEVAEQKEEEESEYMSKIEEKRSTENFVLPDGSQISTGCNCVVVKWSSPEEKEIIYDILKINYGDEFIKLESVLAGNELGFRTLLTNFEEVEGSLIAMGNRNHKKSYEESLFDQYSPCYFEFSPMTFRKAVLTLLKQRMKRRFQLHQHRISPF